ncbi:MAG: zinc ribbon domain-containing protein [bacterium]
MATLKALLDVQTLDVARDRLVLRRETLPERVALDQVLAGRTPLDEAHAAQTARRDERARGERDLGREVAALAARIQEAEETLYSGSVRAPKELESLQEEIRLLRARQDELEEREMTLLEEIEQEERAMRENRARLEESDREADRLRAAIGEAESEIDAELDRLAAERAPETSQLPPAILAEYERLRGRPRLAGRGAAPLDAGSCGGCRVKLPVMEYHRLKAEPEEALLTCMNCGRLLIR